MRWWLFVGTLLALLLVPDTIGAQSDEPFGVQPIVAPTHPIVRREWESMPQKFEADAAALAACRKDAGLCTKRMQTLIALIDKVRSYDIDQRFYTVSAAVNRLVVHHTDLEQWGATEKAGESEVWSSPLEVATAKKGDCEDYVNLKFFLLWQAGVPLQKMRLVVLYYSANHEMHVVLAGRMLKHWVVFDNAAEQLAVLSKVEYVLAPYAVQSSALVATAEATAR